MFQHDLKLNPMNQLRNTIHGFRIIQVTYWINFSMLGHIMNQDQNNHLHQLNR